MRQKKRVINFILAVICCVCMFLGSGVESKAAVPSGGAFEYEGNYYVYERLNYIKTGLDQLYFTESVYSFMVAIPNGSTVLSVTVSDNIYSFTDKYGTEFNSVIYTRNDIDINGAMIHVAYNNLDSHNVNWVSNVDLGNQIVEAFLNYYVDNIYEDPNKFEPDFDNYYHEDNDIWIKDMRSELQEDTLYATWNGLDGKGIHMLQGYENTYIQVYLNFVDDKGTKEIEDDDYWNPDMFYTSLPLNEFSVAMSKFAIPEGYRLDFMIAVPYWYFMDDVESTMFRGKQSLIFFNEDGTSQAPLIKDPDDIYNPLDPNYSNWNAITNFTGDYFYNMGNVMNDTFNNWDGSNMGNDNERLNNSLSSFVQEEDAIFDSISNRLNGFEFDNYLSFGDKVTAGISFGSMLINKFFDVSGDFTILFVVGCVMVFVFIVVGIWRFN